MPLPENLPVPGSVSPILQPALEPQRIEQVSTLASPAPSASFLALDDDNTALPPDTHGAVGPNHLMTTLNTQIRVQDRAGNPLVTRPLEAFWAPARAGVNAFDPRIFYDSSADRWISVACADSSSATSSILVGVSQAGDPTGFWHLYDIDADDGDMIWADYPSVGFNAATLVVQLNMYENCGESSCTDGMDNDNDGMTDERPFVRSQILVFDKAPLYSGSTGTLTRINVTNFGGTQVPTINHDPSAPVYLLQNWNANSNGSGFLRLYMLSGPRGSETLSPISFVTTPNPWDSRPPNGADFAPQLGSDRKIQANDNRIHSAIYRNGSIWAAQSVFLPPGGSPTHAAIQWWEIEPNATVRQRGRIEDPSGASFVAFPSIAVNRNGDALIGYSRFSASQYAGANYSFRAGSDPPNTVRPDVLLKQGEAPYYKVGMRTINRWGDYSATTVDPVNDTDFWTIQEYASVPRGGIDRWGTWWGKVSPMGSFMPIVCTPGDTTLCLNNGRFQAQAIFSAPSLGLSNAPAQAVSLTSDTGYFWFFSASNVEIALKVVDGRALNNFFWVFYGALSNIEYTITVTDTATGTVKTYRNEPGRLASVADVSAFAGGAGPASAISADSYSAASELVRSQSQHVARLLSASAPLVCLADARTLCLNGARFQARANFNAPSLGLTNAPAQVVALTSDTGYFWFFSSNNVEIVIKVVDGRSFNGFFWVFYGALSDVEYTITVTDTVAGAVKTYSNRPGNLASVADVSAFP